MRGDAVIYRKARMKYTCHEVEGGTLSADKRETRRWGEQISREDQLKQQTHENVTEEHTTGRN